MRTLKSIGAILTGFVVIFFLSVVTDVILERKGLLTLGAPDNPAWVFVLVLLCRAIYNTSGAYLTARLAPDNPLRHAMILGVIGFVISISGLVIMWGKTPLWFSISVTILPLPCAWLGGRLKK